jgi:Flp pilus assembly protein TadG
MSCSPVHNSAARRHGSSRARRRGVALIYVLVVMTAMAALASLGVDYARVALVRTEMRSAADSAARAGAVALAGGRSLAAIRADAVALVNANRVENAALPASAVDVEAVYWDAVSRQVITGGSQAPNAVRVALHRTAARANPVRLTFGGLVNVPTVDVRVVSVVTGTNGAPTGFQGLDGITMKNNVFIGSYNSATNTAPTQGSAGNKAVFGSNGVIDGKNHLRVQGDVILGPSGSVDGNTTITGATRRLSSPLPAPTVPAWAPKANPNGVPQAYSVSSNIQLPGGTYWFTSLNVNGSLTFSGPATVIVNGNVNVHGSLTAAGNRPTNLTVYQLGSGRTFGDGNDNGVQITANVIAPGGAFSTKNNATIRGSAIFRTIDAKNNLDMYFDEALGAAAGGVKVVQVK